MRGSLGEARKRAGKREAAVVLVLSLFTLFVIFGTWHVNKIKATAVVGQYHKEETQKKSFSPKTSASHTSQQKTASENKSLKKVKTSSSIAEVEKKSTRQPPSQPSASEQSPKEKYKVAAKHQPADKSVQISPRNENKEPTKAISHPAIHKSIPPQKEGAAEPKTVYLTFDDGPSNVSGGLMDVLSSYNAKATFFMLEPNILRFPEAVKRMDQEGHALGLHGVTHDPKKIYRTKETVVQEMDQDNAALQKVTGKKTVLIRTPYGSAPYMKSPYQKAVKDHGYQLWDWTIDSMDWSFRSPKYVENSINQLKKIAHRKEPIVILMHERKETLESLPKLLEYLQKNGYQFKRIEPDMQPVTFHCK
ncbi:polysaccharide deacetylase family protein [Fictibacillus sp. WQ 8-8]|uniref:polysaccharide deacetylase family protein n=1 Tax=Fictibacillus sp. WQ 8-8 TaxID=2938788 RepID=UPI00210C330B|nr:polysaccharide deacetylase family protein [Fictibacillus sp. WQ 8-8]MCQ6268064.1 polysaccharide deacetylase family protein [Fictibacillus sp. WQ 8-8]